MQVVARVKTRSSAFEPATTRHDVAHKDMNVLLALHKHICGAVGGAARTRAGHVELHASEARELSQALGEAAEDVLLHPVRLEAQLQIPI